MEELEELAVGPGSSAVGPSAVCSSAAVVVGLP